MKERFNWKIVLNIVAVLICIISLFPIYWIIISSFKTSAEIFQSPQTFFPSRFQINTYIDQFIGDNNILVPLKNSLIISFGSMIVSLLLGIPAAYGLVRFKINIKIKRSILFVFLITQMLPVSLVLTPLFLVYSKLGILNTYIAPILSTATISVPFIVLILRPYFLNCPKSLEDAARIDGCSIVTAFIRIMLPITKPGLITASAFSFLFAWNDLIYSMTFNIKTEMRPMTAGIYNYMTKYGLEWNYIMAYGVILVIPVILVFVLLQKYIISGITNGAVKG